jgi:hypothetical protein
MVTSVSWMVASVSTVGWLLSFVVGASILGGIQIVHTSQPSLSLKIHLLYDSYKHKKYKPGYWDSEDLIT